MTLSRNARLSLSLLIGTTSGALLSGCGGGGSSLFNDVVDPGGNPGPDSADFLVESILPQPGQDWEVNRPIEILFNKEVRPDTVTPASISIVQQGTAVPALGTFSFDNGNKKKVIFQPTCPSSTGGGGLQAGGIPYVINIPSSTQAGATTVLSTKGEGLVVGKTSNFITKPAGSGVFYDPKVNESPQVTRVVFVTPNSAGDLVESDFTTGVTIPTNKFVGPSVYFDVTFNQPVDPSATNITASNISLQFNTTGSSFSSIPVSVSLIENCTAAGAKVRVTPLGLLPSGRRIRFLISQGFSDITGETALFPTPIPATFGTEPIVETASTPDYDAIVESFDSAAREDQNPGFGFPAAEWNSQGFLEAGFSFGGQPTDNDLEVTSGQTIFVDTSAATLTLKNAIGSPVQQTFVNGEVFLRRLRVFNGGRLVGQGLNPLQIFANETVQVDAGGQILVTGSDASDVQTLLTAAQFSEPGGAGICGGGSGGVGNPVTSQSSVKGGQGAGPFNVLNGGGFGGESALVPVVNGQQCFENEDRHPAGGGGGSYTTAGEKGNDGPTTASFTIGSCIAPQGVSAVNTATFPQGGTPGPLNFVTSSPTDDFVGTTIVTRGTCITTGTTTQVRATSAIFNTSDVGRFIAIYRTAGTWEDTLAACTTGTTALDPTQCFRSKVLVRQISSVTGDLAAVNFSAPLPVTAATGDLVVLMGRGDNTTGEIVTPLGGQGGGGGGNAIGSTTITNPNFGALDKKGAGGGGGGGILSIQALGKVSVAGTISASGGNGAAGENTIFLDRIGGGSGGGAGGTIIIQSADSIDTFIGATSGTILSRGGRRGGGANAGQQDPVPPNTSLGLGHGGRGGKGLVQLHAPINPATGLYKTAFLGGGTANAQPLPANFDPAPLLLLPEFGSQSRVRSTWFDTGLPLASGKPVYEFAGLALPASGLGPVGKILTDAQGFVAPIVGVSGSVNASSVTANSITLAKLDLIAGGNLKAVEPKTMILDRIRVGSNAGTVVGATESGNNIVLTTDNGSSGNPTALNAGLSGTPAWQLVTRSFEVSTFTSAGELDDFLPPSSSSFAAVQIQFQGADADATGNVNLASIVPTSVQDSTGVGTSDMSILTGKRFIRFTVTFDVALGGTVTASSSKPRVRFLKVPFQFN